MEVNGSHGQKFVRQLQRATVTTSLAHLFLRSLTSQREKERVNASYRVPLSGTAAAGTPSWTRDEAATAASGEPRFRALAGGPRLLRSSCRSLLSVAAGLMPRRAMLGTAAGRSRLAVRRLPNRAILGTRLGEGF